MGTPCWLCPSSHMTVIGDGSGVGAVHEWAHVLCTPTPPLPSVPCVRCLAAVTRMKRFLLRWPRTQMARGDLRAPSSQQVNVSCCSADTMQAGGCAQANSSLDHSLSAGLQRQAFPLPICRPMLRGSYSQLRRGVPASILALLLPSVFVDCRWLRTASHTCFQHLRMAAALPVPPLGAEGWGEILIVSGHKCNHAGRLSCQVARPAMDAQACLLWEAAKFAAFNVCSLACFVRLRLQVGRCRCSGLQAAQKYIYDQ